jgi:hypothetical protein
MHSHLLKASHNEEFHKCICDTFKDKFFDWKVTVLFYIGLHWLKALSKKRSIDIGDSHYDIENAVNPDRSTAIMPIKRGAWREYNKLFVYSRLARYEGITTSEVHHELMNNYYSDCITHLHNFKLYIESQKVPLK